MINLNTAPIRIAAYNEHGISLGWVVWDRVEGGWFEAVLISQHNPDRPLPRLWGADSTALLPQIAMVLDRRLNVESASKPLTKVNCDCGAEVDIDGPLEARHFVFAVRQDGTRSNLGWCPAKDGGIQGAAMKARTSFGANPAMYRGLVLRSRTDEINAEADRAVNPG